MFMTADLAGMVHVTEDGHPFSLEARMHRRVGLLVFLLGSLALCACQGEIALGGAEGDGGPETGSTATGSNSGSGGGSVVGSSLSLIHI